jgi:hypothetical protein
MKKVCVIALMAFMCLGGIGISAHAQDTEGIVVQVPFEFIAGGSTMPAGKYTIGRLSPDSSSSLIIRTYGNGVLVLPIVVAGPYTEQPTLSFVEIGGKRVLRQVKTPAGVYTLALPRSMAAMAAVKNQVPSSAAGTN